jgi:hypothetical protein
LRSDRHPGPRSCVASFMMDQTGPTFLIILAIVFGSYGAHELSRAYRTGPMNEWWDRVLPGASGLDLAIFFTTVALRTIG